VVLSLIGAMFAPRPDRVAAELIRVCKPGGRIIMANWTPAGFVGQMFKVHAAHVPPPPLMAPPVAWGREETVRERPRDGIAELRLARRMYPFKYPFPPPEVVAFFGTYYGPTNRAFAALDPGGQAAPRRDLEQLWSERNLAGGGATHVESEYLEVVATKTAARRAARTKAGLEPALLRARGGRPRRHPAREASLHSLGLEPVLDRLRVRPAPGRLAIVREGPLEHVGLERTAPDESPVGFAHSRRVEADHTAASS